MAQAALKKGYVGHDDSMSSILAALARIEEVPPGSTLIDQIPDEDWLDDEAFAWIITAGSGGYEAADELDGSDVAA